MSADQRFALLISALGLIFLVMSALLGFVIKVTRGWTRTEDKLTDLVDDVRELVVKKDKDHEQIRREAVEAELRSGKTHDEFRERLTWLERRELDQRRRQERRLHRPGDEH